MINQEFITKLDKLFVGGLAGFCISSVAIISLGLIVKYIIRLLLQGHYKVNGDKRKLLLKMAYLLVNVSVVFGILNQILIFKEFNTTILAGSSIIMVAIGFAAQEAMGNIIAGFFLSIFHPFDIGDTIVMKEKNISGKVEDINLRHTIIRSFENTKIIIPNGIMNTAILENKHLGVNKICNMLYLTVDYQNDIEKVKDVITKVITSNPHFFDGRTKEEIKNNEPLVNIYLTNLDKLGMEFRVALWSEDPKKGFVLLAEAREALINAFKKEKIVMASQVVRLAGYEKE